MLIYILVKIQVRNGGCSNPPAESVHVRHIKNEPSDANTAPNAEATVIIDSVLGRSRVIEYPNPHGDGILRLDEKVFTTNTNLGGTVDV